MFDPLIAQAEEEIERLKKGEHPNASPPSGTEAHATDSAKAAPAEADLPQRPRSLPCRCRTSQWPKASRSSSGRRIPCSKSRRNELGPAGPALGFE